MLMDGICIALGARYRAERVMRVTAVVDWDKLEMGVVEYRLQVACNNTFSEYQVVTTVTYLSRQPGRPC